MSKAFHKRIGRTVTGIFVIACLVCAPVSAVTVSSDHWSKNCITYLENSNIFNETHLRDLNGTDELTRAEFIAIMARSLSDMDISGIDSSGFDDVDDTDWFFDYVVMANEEGWLIDYDDDNLFGPEEKISREEMIRTIASTSMLAVMGNGTALDFDDIVRTGEDKYEYLDELDRSTSNGIIIGSDNNKFLPDKNLSLDELSTTIFNMWGGGGLLK